MSFSARVLADSVNPSDGRLASLEITFPRIVLAEFNTHRVFSRNAASSRAIPVSKMLARVKEDPFLPVFWGKNQSGMAAAEELSGDERGAAEFEWLEARDSAVRHVEALQKIGLHKQIANRILEPWLWVTVVVSSTDWRNFFALRCHPAAQPEIQRIAGMMEEALAASTPKRLREGEWHMPYMNDAHDLVMQGVHERDLPWVSAGRCARTSYLNQEGIRDPNDDIRLADRLAGSHPGHWSPFEHVARADVDRARVRNFRGFTQLRAMLDQTSVED